MSRRADVPAEVSASGSKVGNTTRIALLGLLVFVLVVVPDVTLMYRLAVGSLHGTALIYALISCVAVTLVVGEGTAVRIRRWRG